MPRSCQAENERWCCALIKTLNQILKSENRNGLRNILLVIACSGNMVHRVGKLCRMGIIVIRCNTIGRGRNMTACRPCRHAIREVAVLDHVVPVRCRSNLQLCRIYIYGSYTRLGEFNFQCNRTDATGYFERHNAAHPIRACRSEGRNRIGVGNLRVAVQRVQLCAGLTGEIRRECISLSCSNRDSLRRTDCRTRCACLSATVVQFQP